MKRLLFFAAFLAVVWYFGTHGQSLKDFVLSPVNMVKGTSSGVELHNIRKALIIYHKVHDSCLAPSQFTEYLKQEFRSVVKDPTLDPWERPYRYSLIAGGFQIESSGPDRRFGTTDDLRIKWKE